MNTNTTQLWDKLGNLAPGTTVRQWAEDLRRNTNGGNVTINHVFYDLHKLLISPPYGVDLDAVIIALDYGYYGTPGVLTE